MPLSSKYDSSRSIPIQSSTSVSASNLQTVLPRAASPPSRAHVTRTQSHHGHLLQKTTHPQNPTASINLNVNANSTTNGQLFPQWRGQSTAVFDPSEFPSLAGGVAATSPPATNATNTNTLSHINGVDAMSSALSSLSLSTANGLTSYYDLLFGGAYAAHRSKQAGPQSSVSPTEFSVQNEDFPALSNQVHPDGTPGPSPVQSRATDKSDPVFERQSVLEGHVIDRLPGSTMSISAAKKPAIISGNGDSSVNTFPSPSTSVSLASSVPFPFGHPVVGEGKVSSQDSGNFAEARYLQGPSLNPILAGMRNDRSTLWADSASGNISEVALLKSGPSVSSLYKKDVYGVKSLLHLVSVESEGTSEKALAVGLDLTSLGLDLNSPEPLYKTFDSPWEGGQGTQSDRDAGLVQGNTARTKEASYKLPSCYYMQPPGLRSSHFSKFQLGTLFYIFYNMPGDVLQLLAAIELYARTWHYHKGLKLWFSCDAQILSSYSRGVYVYFDIKAWERRPFHDANQSFIQGFMTEEELRSFPVPTL